MNARFMEYAAGLLLFGAAAMVWGAWLTGWVSPILGQVQHLLVG